MDAPRVVILQGPFNGNEGPVVGIDQERGTVQVRITLIKKDTIITVNVRDVRRIDFSDIHLAHMATLWPS